MKEAQIKYMVSRFLAWRLPENFAPDGGISFKKTFNEHTAHPMNYEPTGTNLFDAAQAEAMILHMIDGLLPDEYDTVDQLLLEAMEVLYPVQIAKDATRGNLGVFREALARKGLEVVLKNA